MQFTRSGIAALLDFHPTHNLGESTGVDLVLDEFLDDEGLQRLRGLRLGYGSSQGDAELRSLLGKMLGVDPEDVIVTSGGSASFAVLALTLLDPGAHAIVTSPNFPPTLDAILALGADRDVIDLRFDEGYEVDPGRVIDSIRPDTTLVHLTTPANPSGTAIPHETVTTIADNLASVAPAGLVVVDESYRQARHGDRPEAPSFSDSRPNVAVTGSLSKCHGAPGLRTGWIVVSERELRDRLITARLNVFISNSVVDEFLAIEVLRRSDELLAHRARVLEKGRRLVAEWVATHEDEIDWIEPAAGALCTIRTKPQIDIDRFRAALTSNDAMLGDGEWFHTEPGVFRVGFGYLPIEKLPAALAAVGDALEAART
jgi:aspartate/methionine/tyrosine aminotransferase